MSETLTKDDQLFIKCALSYYAQFYFDRGVFINEDGCADIREDCYAVVQKCDEIIDKLKD